MNFGTAPAKEKSLPAVETPAESPLDDFQEIYSRGMDKALGLQHASLAAAVQLHSEVLDSYTDTCRQSAKLAPSVLSWFDAAAAILTSFMEWQMALLSMFIPVSPAVSRPASAPQAEEMERVMDVGTGQRKKPAARKPAI